LTNPVEDQEILYEVLHGGKKELACDRLIDIANERGGKDNITVVLLEI
jgi:protein phosphatase